MWFKKSPRVIIETSDDEFMPKYAHTSDAGADVMAYKIHGCDDIRPEQIFETFSTDVETGAVTKWSYVLHPGMAVLVECGFKCELPNDYAFFVCPRSGLAIKNYITVLNAPGICDAGYRGNYGVILFNAGQYDFEIHKGDRIAQIVLVHTPQAQFVKGTLNNSDRGKGGFGSSGIKNFIFQNQKGGDNSVQIQSNITTDYEKKIMLEHLDKSIKEMKDTMKMCQEDLEKSSKELQEDMKNNHNLFKESSNMFKDGANLFKNASNTMFSGFPFHSSTTVTYRRNKK